MQVTPLFHRPPRADTAAEPYPAQKAVRYDPRQDGTSVRAFEKSERGKQLMTQYRAGIGKLKAFLHEHPSATSQQSADALDVFRSRVEAGIDGHFSTQIARLYGEGKASLDALCVAMADEAIPLSTRMEIIENLAEGLLVCSEGTTSNLIMAVQDMNLAKGLHSHARKTWENMLDQAVRDFSQSKHGRVEHYAGNEIHYVNGYRNFLADEFKVAERSDSFVDQQAVSNHAEEAAGFVRARVNPEQLVSHLAETCLSEIHEHFREHLGRPLTLETAFKLRTEYENNVEAGLQSRFGPIPGMVVISEHEPTGDEDAPYSIVMNPALLMRSIAKNMKTQGLLEKEKFAAIDTASTEEGNRKIKQITDGAFYVKETTTEGEAGYRDVRVSDLPADGEWSSALLMNALTVTKDPEELRSLDPERVWALIRSSAEQGGASWQATLMHPALQRYRAASPAIESFLVNKAVEEVDNLPEAERPAAVAKSLMAGDTATASWLATLPMPSSWVDANKNTLLHHAVAAGADSLVSMLMTPALLETTNARGDTPLLHAARYGRTTTVHQLLQAKADIGKSNQKGETALYLAVQAGDAASVGVLVQASLQNAKARSMLNAASRTGRTPLMVAAASGQTAIVKMLHSAGANVNAYSSDGTTALHEAARHGRMDCARMLLDARADPKAFTGILHGGVTPLMEALDRGHYEMAALLAPKSNLSQPDWDMNGALARAVNQKNMRAAEFLIGAGARVKGSLIGANPLRNAAITGQPEMVDLLLKSGGKPDEGDIIAAAGRGHTAALELLLDANPREYLVSIHRKPFQEAVSNGHVETVDALLRRNAPKDLRWKPTEDDHTSPVVYAAANGHADMVELLLRRKICGVEDRAFNGDTALVMAAAKGHTAVVKLLLQAGAREGLEQARRIARSEGHPEVLELLAAFQKTEGATRPREPRTGS
ncbi:ankyrin repeat domain-containing protein [Acidovorax sp. NCPPB 4044]|uniref:ankyrin repeat domain-containing protein n=1 Tax=Acidovorax sp. NCPPB 4044 TaxID=2940490 RepID=UPI002303AD8E|nr:ankyrin repeat domain-containing protein [Acidovorax sp. NCPPB 4044]MDA8519477.1 ankyrin repeat domain-containing protein [Acidovorax sp. NCPPB 4044]